MTEAQVMENSNSEPKRSQKKTMQGSQSQKNGVAATEKLGGFQHYPTLRDHPLKSADMWMQGKRVDDNVGQYWRIHDKLYDLTNFAHTHPGGKEWITLTRGTDITEAFESYHVTGKPQALLSKFYVKDISTPRNSPYTFHEDGFFRTFKRKVQPILKEAGCGPTWSMLLLQDGFVVTFVFLAVAAAVYHSYTLAALAGTVLSLTVTCAHNFFHQRDNWRMYYFDLSVLSSHDWRVTHGISHHMFPNTLYDIEVSILEPFWAFLPRLDKPLLQRYGSWIYEHFFMMTGFLIEFVKKIVLLAIGWSTLRPENFLPLVELVVMAALASSLSAAFKLWLAVHVSFSYVFFGVGLVTGHHHPDVYHHGDATRDNPDWGLSQLDAVRDRAEISGNLFLVAISFGDHTLHHLLPAVDHSKLPLLYPAFLETCKEFNIPFKFTSVLEMIKGKYLQLANNKPNSQPPGYKHKNE